MFVQDLGIWQQINQIMAILSEHSALSISPLQTCLPTFSWKAAWDKVKKHELMAVIERRGGSVNRWVEADGLTEAARRQLMLRSNTVVMSRALRRQRQEVKEASKESESVRVNVRLSL